MHGTGLYLKRIYAADLQKEEYAVIFSRVYNYFYPTMSDCYEPSCEALDEYQVEIIKWRKDPHTKNGKVADHLSETIRITSINKDIANKVYWNLKHRDLTFEEVKMCVNQLSL